MRAFCNTLESTRDASRCPGPRSEIGLEAGAFRPVQVTLHANAPRHKTNETNEKMTTETAPAQALITAAVCTYNRYDTLADTIGSLLAQSLPRQVYQILVVDNSPDAVRARQFAQSYAANGLIRFVHLTESGLSNARNFATGHCRSPYVAFIDDDAVAVPDWLANIVDLFEREPGDVAGVGGPAEPQWEAPRPPWLHDHLLGYVGVLNWGDKLFEADEDHWLIGTNVAYRRDVVEQVGGFRTDLGRRGSVLLSNEETELGSRLRLAGYRLLYSPAIRVKHRVAKQRLTREWIRRRVFWQAVSDLIAAESAPTIDPSSASRLPWDWWPRETSDPKKFSKQCYRIVDLLKQLDCGRRAA